VHPQNFIFSLSPKGNGATHQAAIKRAAQGNPTIDRQSRIGHRKAQQKDAMQRIMDGDALTQ
jgi:hypothetical protein